MGKGGRGGKRGVPCAAEEDDDALLAAAMASAKIEADKMEQDRHMAEEAKKVEVQRARAAKIKAEVEAAKADASAPPLSQEEICQKLDVLPAFCIVDEQRQFVPIVVSGETAACCIFWVEPIEAEMAIKQAKMQQPDAKLAVGTIPLGKAFALSEGWAEAEGGLSFRLRAHAEVAKHFRGVLTKQLEQHGMSTAQVFPVFTCEELTTNTVMPFFLSRVEMVSTFEELMRQRGSERPPPTQMTVLDLRFLAQRMQSGGVDWSIVQFVGTVRAREAVREAEKQEAARATQSDSGDEPPPLL